jgi:hypothetical protein
MRNDMAEEPPAAGAGAAGGQPTAMKARREKAPPGRSLGGTLSQRLAWALVMALLPAALVWPAVSNRFPLIFYDTGGYLARPFEQTLEIGRSALYGAFLAAGIPLDFWPNVVAQAAIAAWLLVLTLRAHGFGRRPVFALLVTLVLAVLTSLPWYAAQLMPDVLVPEGVLALYLLSFRRPMLRRHEVVLLCATIAFAIASHMGTLGLMLGLITVLVALRAIAHPFAPERLAMPAIAIVLGVALALLSNLAIAGRFAFTPGGGTIAFVRLVDDGLAKRYLDDKCPDPNIRLCAYRDALPVERDSWIWGKNSPLHELGGWQGHEAEALRIFAETLLLYPGQHVKSAFTNTVEQFVRGRTGDGLAPWAWDTRSAVERYAPHSYGRFVAARQQTEPFDMTWLNVVHVPVFVLSVVALPLLAGLAGTRVRSPAAAFAAFVFAALVINAAICGVFASPNDRYQSRLAPLATLAVTIAALGWRSRRPVTKVAATTADISLAVRRHAV